MSSDYDGEITKIFQWVGCSMNSSVDGDEGLTGCGGLLQEMEAFDGTLSGDQSLGADLLSQSVREPLTGCPFRPV
jgi:hypothetical protein